MNTVTCYFFECGCKVDWPAWIQAVGSVAAILIAIWVSRKDRNHSNLVLRESNLRKLKVTFSIVEVAIDVNKSILDEVDSGRVVEGRYTTSFSTNGLQDLIYQLNNAPIFEYEDSAFAIMVIKIIRNLKLIAERLELINNSNLVYVTKLERDITTAKIFIDSLETPMRNIILKEELEISEEKVRLL